MSVPLFFPAHAAEKATLLPAARALLHDHATCAAALQRVSGKPLFSVVGLAAAFLTFLAAPAPAQFGHELWQNLLERHVRWVDSGHATVVDYAGLERERESLDRYLAQLSEVSPTAFATWASAERLAFLLNAYNAFTVQLVLTRYPHLRSIKELGTWLRTPWQNPFAPLLGKRRSLDDIEHGLIRGSPDYRDPRVHFALNCASVGCPALRNEAYRGAILDRQLEDQAHRFLSDRRRNRLVHGRLEVSPIFRWYREDFERGFRGTTNLATFLAAYAEDLGLSAEQAEALRSGKLKITFGDYDWRLNDDQERDR